MLWDSYLFI